MKSFATFLILSCSLTVLANQTDSLRMAQWISSARLRMNTDANMGKVYLDSLRAFLDRHEGYNFQEGEYYKFMAIYHYRKSNYDSSLFFYEQANGKYATLGNVLEQAKVSVNVSMVYNKRGAYLETIEYASRALAMFEELGDEKGIGISLNIIGQVYFANGDFGNALVYFRRYVSNAHQAKDSTEIASGYANVGSAFLKQKDYDSSTYYIRMALQIQRKLGALYSIGNALQNLGTIYQEQGMLDSATYYLEDAITYYQKVDNESGLAEVYFNLGITTSQQGRFKQAIAHHEKSLAVSQQTGELFLQKENLLNLSRNYEKIGLRDKAFELYKAYDVLSDSILNEKNRNYLEDINAKYETEKKEQQIAIQQIALDQQKAHIKLNYTIIAALCLGVFLLIVIFLLIKNKVSRKQEYLRKENDFKLRETYINASIQSQEIERKRFAQDLHDGIGQLISSLRLLLGNINSNSPMESRVAVVSKSEEIIDEMQKEIRGIAFNLMPQTLIQHGLVPALKEMGLRITSSGKVVVSVGAFETPERLSELQEISLYRTIQEWTNNILKYAQASTIEIQLVGHGDELSVTIEDNGKGFDVSLLATSEGNGWRNILSRIKLLHGEVDVDSSVGRGGTILIVRVPIAGLVISDDGGVGVQNTQ